MKKHGWWGGGGTRAGRSGDVCSSLMKNVEPSRKC